MTVTGEDRMISGDVSLQHADQPNNPLKKQLQTKPQGVLAVHVKQIHFKTKHFANYFDSGGSIAAYVHIHVAGQTRATPVYKNIQFPSTIVFDDIKHFSVTSNPRRSDPENEIRIELIGFERPHVHHILSTRHVHLHDIIKRMYAVVVYPMMSNDTSDILGELQIEYCFAYGEMGYGASSQMRSLYDDPPDLIRRSLFPRAAPPVDRVLDNDTDVMSCVPVGAPDFLPFPERSQLSHYDHHAPAGTEGVDEFKVQPTVLMNKIKKKIAGYQGHMDGLLSRKERVNFIRDLASPTILNHPDDEDEIKVAPELKLKEYDGSLLNAYNQAIGPEADFSDYLPPSVIEDMDSVFREPPGPIMRRRSPMDAMPVAGSSLLPAASGSDPQAAETDRAEGRGRAPSGVRSLFRRLYGLLNTPYHRRSSRVGPLTSDVFGGEEQEMQERSGRNSPTHSYYSAELNVLTQDPSHPDGQGVFDQDPMRPASPPLSPTPSQERRSGLVNRYQQVSEGLVTQPEPQQQSSEKNAQEGTYSAAQRYPSHERIKRRPKTPDDLAPFTVTSEEYSGEKKREFDSII